jgi:hypothetical protein
MIMTSEERADRTWTVLSKEPINCERGESIKLIALAIRAAIIEERERCAVIVETMPFDFDFSWERGQIAGLIRSNCNDGSDSGLIQAETERTDAGIGAYLTKGPTKKNLASLLSVIEGEKSMIGLSATTPLGPGKIRGYQVQVCVELDEESPEMPGRTNCYFDAHKIELLTDGK